jgi:hypothetical protein
MTVNLTLLLRITDTEKWERWFNVFVTMLPFGQTEIACDKKFCGGRKMSTAPRCRGGFAFGGFKSMKLWGVEMPELRESRCEFALQ